MNFERKVAVLDIPEVMSQTRPIIKNFNWKKMKEEMSQLKKYLSKKPKQGTLDDLGVYTIPCKVDLRQALYESHNALNTARNIVSNFEEAKYNKFKRNEMLWYKDKHAKKTMPIKKSMKTYRKVKRKFDKKFDLIKEKCETQRVFPKRVEDLPPDHIVFQVPVKKSRNRVMTPEYESRPIDFETRKNSSKLFQRFTKDEMLKYVEPQRPKMIVS